MKINEGKGRSGREREFSESRKPELVRGISLNKLRRPSIPQKWKEGVFWVGDTGFSDRRAEKGVEEDVSMLLYQDA